MSPQTPSSEEALLKGKEALQKIKGEAQPFPWWEPKEHINPDNPVKLHISVPTYDNRLSLILDSGLKYALGTSRIGPELLHPNVAFVGGDSLISRARDKMAAQFLDSDAEWQLQIDDDIIFPSALGAETAKFYSAWMDPEIFDMFMREGVFRAALQLNAIDEILRSAIVDGKKIVGGLYFWRGGARAYNQAASLLPSSKDGTKFEIEFKLRPNNYVNTDRLATGFLLVHRSVYEAVQEKFPELAYDVPQASKRGTTYAFYNTNVTKERDEQGRAFRFYRSEDYAFTWRAKQCGFEPCLNMNILLGHVGTHVYSWFDRPTLQKLFLEMFGHPAHRIEKVDN